MKKTVSLVAILILVISFLCFPGCSRHVSEEQDSDELTANYLINEFFIPDPNDALSCADSDFSVRELDLRLFGDSLVRIVQVWDYSKEYQMNIDSFFIQKLCFPYNEWETIAVPYLNLPGEFDAEELLHGYCPTKLICAYNDKILFAGNSLSNYKVAVGAVIPDGCIEMIYGVKGFDCIESDDALNGYKAFCGSENDVLFLKDSDKSVIADYSCKNNTLSWLDNPNEYSSFMLSPDDRLIGYGNGDYGFTAEYIDNCDKIISVFPEEYINVMIPYRDGFMLVGASNLWSVDKQGKYKKILSFKERSYFFDYIEQAWFEDNVLYVYGSFEKKGCIITIDFNRVIEDSCQEITINPVMDMPVLEYYISRFNRMNQDYRIVIHKPDSKNEFDFLKYCDELRSELAIGKGPDILLSGTLEFNDMAESGFVWPVDDVIINRDEYIEGAILNGEYNGTLYGIPYEFYLETASYSKEIIGDIERISTRELIESVENSNTDLLARGLSGYDIVMYYGLVDNDNKDFIDWEIGESYLEGEEFVKLLNFADNYKDKGYINDDNYEQMLDNGEIASEKAYLFGKLDMLRYLDACFEGDAAQIGFPCENGNGYYIHTNMMYLNANSKVKEGVKDFFRFIISEESQMLMADEQYKDIEDRAVLSMFPVNKRAFKELLDITLEQKKTLSKYNGISFYTGEYDKSDSDLFNYIMENAKPSNAKIYTVADVVSEELDPFFEGARTAEETARILDSRVQLYLDERKK